LGSGVNPLVQASRPVVLDDDAGTMAYSPDRRTLVVVGADRTVTL
jgi:hypothetical protein